jgi:hypothetical protein
MSAFVTPFGALASNFFVSPFLKRVRLCQGSAASSLCTAAYPRTLYSIYSHIWCLYFRGGGAAEPQVGSRRAFELGTVLGAAAWLLKVLHGRRSHSDAPLLDIPIVSLHTDIVGRRLNDSTGRGHLTAAAKGQCWRLLGTATAAAKGGAAGGSPPAVLSN